MLVLLLPADEGDVRLGQETASRLAGLGVRHATVMRDAHTVAVILDGWSFDPLASAGAAVELVAGPDRSCRVLRPVAQLAVEPTSAGP